MLEKPDYHYTRFGYLVVTIGRVDAKTPDKAPSLSLAENLNLQSDLKKSWKGGGQELLV